MFKKLMRISAGAALAISLFSCDHSPVITDVPEITPMTTDFDDICARLYNCFDAPYGFYDFHQDPCTDKVRIEKHPGQDIASADPTSKCVHYY